MNSGKDPKESAAKGEKRFPPYEKIKYFIQTYGSAGIPDKRAVEEFSECESDEAIQGLKRELHQVMQGNFDPEIFGKLVGKARIVRHESYENWGKLMMQWFALAKK